MIYTIQAIYIHSVSIGTTSAQSASVTINDSYIGTVSCDFAPGSTAQGCMVSFTQVDSNGNRTFLFNVNINVSRPTVNDVVFNEVPDGSEIVSTVQDLQSNGRVGLVSAPASVIGPFTPTTQPPQPGELCVTVCVCVCVRVCVRVRVRVRARARGTVCVVVSMHAIKYTHP